MCSIGFSRNNSPYRLVINSVSRVFMNLIRIAPRRLKSQTRVKIQSSLIRRQKVSTLERPFEAFDFVSRPGGMLRTAVTDKRRPARLGCEPQENELGPRPLRHRIVERPVLSSVFAINLRVRTMPTKGLSRHKRRFAAWWLCLALAALVMTLGTHPFPSFAIVGAQTELLDARVPGGALMIIGGGAVTPDIRRQFVELAGGAQARIVLIPGTDPSPEAERELLSPWRASGIASIVLLHARNREMANDPRFCVPLKQATGVWFGGGYQSLLAERYVDTAVQVALHELLQRNGVVGGCSAGAALLSRVMIRDGDTTPVEARGLDLLSNAIIDQHFLARNRLWRLEQMLDIHPDLIGLGIDEATALVIHLHSWELSVVGESYVVACLPRASGQSPRIEILKSGDDITLSQLREDHLAYHPSADWNVLAGDR